MALNLCIPFWPSHRSTDNRCCFCHEFNTRTYVPPSTYTRCNCRSLDPGTSTNAVTVCVIAQLPRHVMLVTSHTTSDLESAGSWATEQPRSVVANERPTGSTAMSCGGAEELVEVTNRHAYWCKKLSAMKTKLDKIEDQRDNLQKATGELRMEVAELRSRIERNSSALKEVSQLKEQQEQLFRRDKTLLEKHQADLFVETSQSQKLLSELEESTKKFLQWNSILESQDPKDMYIRHLVEESSNFYLRRFQVLSEPEAARRLREVSDSLDALRERAILLVKDIEKSTEKKRCLERDLAKEIRNAKRKSKLEKEVNRLEKEMYSELRRTSNGREDLEHEVHLLQVQLQDMAALDEYSNDIGLQEEIELESEIDEPFKERDDTPCTASQYSEESLPNSSDTWDNDNLR